MDVKDKLWIPRLVLGETGSAITQMAKKAARRSEPPVTVSLSMNQEEEYHGYPRPQLRRDSFFSLNGIWDLAAEVCLEGSSFPYSIKVPYPIEAKLSGYTGPVTDCYTYRKRFSLPEGFEKELTLLHFGAVDQIAHVYLNGTSLGSHGGGYLPFSFDITKYLQKENELRVVVEDTLDPTYPYGKQTKTPEGMWYTPVSGIWQTVWIESVPEQYIESVTCVYKEPYMEIDISGSASSYQMDLQGSRYLLKNGRNRLFLENPHLWSPEDPYLYHFELSTSEDCISSYFVARTISIERCHGRDRILLNHRPYFFHGVLDQGYFPDGLFTPKSDRCYEMDIRNMKELGFNMIRKHIKVEPAIFYYECDRLGMAVFQDMVNNGPYNHLRDTVLPTLSSKEKDDTVKKPTAAHHFFISHSKETIRHLKGFPSIVLYTVFNEGWGQFSSEKVTRILKSVDNSRLYDSASGWFLQNTEDIYSQHVYFHKVWPMKRGDLRPHIISECGGYARRVKDHMYSPKKVYGYGTCDDEETLTKEICSLYEKEIIPEISKGCCASVYTQLSDIEEEINGLYTYDRMVCKVNKEKIRKISNLIQEAVTQI